MKSLYLFLITLTAFMSISNFAYGSPDKTDKEKNFADFTDEEKKFADFLVTLPIAEGILEILKLELEQEE